MCQVISKKYTFPISPATLLTLGICWEMDGQSFYDYYVKLVKEMHIW
jgi:hypothetical protein